MKHHYSERLIERYSMGTLVGPELAKIEMHLMTCIDCQNAVSAMDGFLGAFRDMVEDHQSYEQVESRLKMMHPSVMGDYALVRVEGRNIEAREVGIVLIDAKPDRLYQRFRRDWESFAGEEAQWLKRLPDDVSNLAKRRGANLALKWLSGFTAIVKVIFSKTALVMDSPITTVNKLYAEHIHSNILPFVTHLPQYSLEAAAGKFGRKMESDPEGWVEVSADQPLADDMFVIHIKGQSMEPEIPDGSLGAFRSKIEGSLNGKVLLIEDYGESGGNRYTVKLCRLSPTADPNKKYDSVWLHPKMMLESFNPAYEPLEIGVNAKIRAIGEYMFVV